MGQVLIFSKMSLATIIPRIHLIEHDHQWREIDAANSIWESGYWQHFDANNARTLIGGSIFFHLTKADRAYMSGRIINIRLAGDNERRPGSIIFVFVRDSLDQRLLAGGTDWEPAYRPYRKVVY